MVTSSDTGAATVSSSSLDHLYQCKLEQFPQTITVTGVNDDLADESVTITSSVNDGSSDDDFDPLAIKRNGFGDR
ncbi:MAG: hypothetical protein R3A45_03045 [Bdellovibrionota bacterium]